MQSIVHSSRADTSMRGHSVYIQTSDEVADWVYQNSPVKYKLIEADADLVEANLRRRIAASGSGAALSEG
jgi:hypothetical protein